MLYLDLQNKQFVILQMISEINNWINSARRMCSIFFWLIQMFKSGENMNCIYHQQRNLSKLGEVKWSAHTSCVAPTSMDRNGSEVISGAHTSHVQLYS